VYQWNHSSSANSSNAAWSMHCRASVRMSQHAPTPANPHLHFCQWLSSLEFTLLNSRTFKDYGLPQTVIFITSIKTRTRIIGLPLKKTRRKITMVQKTHTHLTALFQDYPGEPVPERKHQFGFHWSKRQWLAVASAGPYASLHLAQTDSHASTPPLSFLQAGCPSCRPTNSVKALKA